jgi:hypothetical protein
MFLKKIFAIFQFLQEIFNQNFKHTTSSLVFILAGFVLGNLIGIVKNTLLLNNIFILVVIGLIEYITFRKYFTVFNNSDFLFLRFWNKVIGSNQRILPKIQNKNFKTVQNFSNSLKRGFLIGIFVEAFKVGS